MKQNGCWKFGSFLAGPGKFGNLLLCFFPGGDTEKSKSCKWNTWKSLQLSILFWAYIVKQSYLTRHGTQIFGLSSDILEFLSFDKRFASVRGVTFWLNKFHGILTRGYPLPLRIDMLVGGSGWKMWTSLLEYIRINSAGFFHCITWSKVFDIYLYIYIYIQMTLGRKPLRVVRDSHPNIDAKHWVGVMHVYSVGNGVWSFGLRSWVFLGSTQTCKDTPQTCKDTK